MNKKTLSAFEDQHGITIKTKNSNYEVTNNLTRNCITIEGERLSTMDAKDFLFVFENSIFSVESFGLGFITFTNNTTHLADEGENGLPFFGFVKASFKVACSHFEEMDETYKNLPLRAYDIEPKQIDEFQIEQSEPNTTKILAKSY
jgi:hypothetical protein